MSYIRIIHIINIKIEFRSFLYSILPMYGQAFILSEIDRNIGLI